MTQPPGLGTETIISMTLKQTVGIIGQNVVLGGLVSKELSVKSVLLH